MVKPVKVSPAVLALCFVKAELASELTREETQSLMNWCDYQRESLWEDMNLQEILNVYRVSAEYDSFEGWESEDSDAARKAWNRVVRPANRLVKSI